MLAVMVVRGAVISIAKICPVPTLEAD